MKPAEQWATEHQFMRDKYNPGDYVEMPSEMFAALVREIQADALTWAAKMVNICYRGNQAVRVITREAIILRATNKETNK